MGGHGQAPVSIKHQWSSLYAQEPTSTVCGLRPQAHPQIAVVYAIASLRLVVVLCVRDVGGHLR